MNGNGVRSSNTAPKGTVYTPGAWADWAVDTYGIAESWINGARILDPGCGEGALVLAVVRKALKWGFIPRKDDLRRLRCIDRDAAAMGLLRSEAGRIGVRLPEEATLVADYLLADPRFEADIVFANPPWTTFADLDEGDKNAYRNLFRNSGLAPDAQSLLLGGSRIDIAALFVLTALGRDASPGAAGYFFLPASIHRGEGAHEAFRRLDSLAGRPFALEEYRDLDGGAPFPGAGTRRSFAVYRTDVPQRWPVPWFTAEGNGLWTRREAQPVGRAGSPLMPVLPGKRAAPVPSVPVPEGTTPRQGANSCGAAAAFILERVEDAGGDLVKVLGKDGTAGVLPRKLVHPLLTGGSFDRTAPVSPPKPKGPGNPRRWIFLPYGESGKILTEAELREHPSAADWLERYRNALVRRRGVLIRRKISEGLWWALLGVGPYSFAPWKIVWESYGRRRFLPLLVRASQHGCWQGNQAMHASLSFFNENEAERAYGALSRPEVEEYLTALGGADTKGWAQPGRIKRILVSE